MSSSTAKEVAARERKELDEQLRRDAEDELRIVMENCIPDKIEPAMCMTPGNWRWLLEELDVAAAALDCGKKDIQPLLAQIPIDKGCYFRPGAVSKALVVEAQKLKRAFPDAFGWIKDMIANFNIVDYEAALKYHAFDMFMDSYACASMDNGHARLWQQGRPGSTSTRAEA